MSHQCEWPPFRLHKAGATLAAAGQRMPGGYILVIDDAASARNGLAELLGGEGYRVETAANGFSALSKLEQSEPDILLTDLKMPGMDGIELLRRLRTLPRNGVLAVVMTAFGAMETAVSP